MMLDGDYNELSELAANAVALMRQERDEARKERDEARWLFAHAISKMGKLEIHNNDFRDMRGICLEMERNDYRDVRIYRHIDGTSETQNVPPHQSHSGQVGQNTEKSE
ncbi:hypothetical protein [Henriciella pelagia]|uniref:hypothetical protein n=1 Tax=Henriciella pelagia TaxID=1977912 RepID=UPI003517D57A